MDNPVLARTYNVAHLSAELTTNSIDQTVLVQAAATVHETEYMLGIADSTPHVAAVVGWIDFEDAREQETLERLAGHPKFVGLRPMIQDIADDDWMLRDDVQWAYRAIAAHNLAFDALGFPRHLENFLSLLREHEQMRAVVDHCMKPSIAHHTDESFAHWANGIERIARETGAFCKLSGLVTEAGENWTLADLRPYVDHVLSVFGPERIMWGSDWPVCRLRAEYTRWCSAAEALVDELSDDEKRHIFGGTAIRFYGLSGSYGPESGH